MVTLSKGFASFDCFRCPAMFDRMPGEYGDVGDASIPAPGAPGGWTIPLCSPGVNWLDGSSP